MDYGYARFLTESDAESAAAQKRLLAGGLTPCASSLRAINLEDFAPYGLPFGKCDVRSCQAFSARWSQPRAS